MCNGISCANFGAFYAYVQVSVHDLILPWTPAQIRFLNNHHLLQVTGKPSWLTIKGGRYPYISLGLQSIRKHDLYSRVYVENILTALPKDCLHLSTPVQSLSTLPVDINSPPSVQLTTAEGHTTTYDHVILACHSDTALAILMAGQGTTENEKNILGRFQWNRNEAVLHSDIRLMPRSRLAWSCWNYLTSSVVNEKGKRKANVDRVAL
jgi:predicted NAD/FAD-binding protein